MTRRHQAGQLALPLTAQSSEPLPAPPTTNREVVRLRKLLITERGRRFNVESQLAIERAVNRRLKEGLGQIGQLVNQLMAT